MTIQYSQLDDTIENVSAAHLYDLLSNRRRRYVLAVLSRRTQPVAIADLAKEIADWEMDGSDTTPPADLSQRIRIDLCHIHAPKLAEADLIEFNQANNTIAPPEDSEPLETVEPLLSSQ